MAPALLDNVNRDGVMHLETNAIKNAPMGYMVKVVKSSVENVKVTDHVITLMDPVPDFVNPDI